LTGGGGFGSRGGHGGRKKERGRPWCDI
jgi:hypothetical protein